MKPEQTIENLFGVPWEILRRIATPPGLLAPNTTSSISLVFPGATAQPVLALLPSDQPFSAFATNKGSVKEGEGSRVAGQDTLAFVGDKLLGAAVAHTLVSLKPGSTPAALSASLSRYTSNRSLTLFAEHLRIPALLGQTEAPLRLSSAHSWGTAIEAAVAVAFLHGTQQWSTTLRIATALVNCIDEANMANSTAPRTVDTAAASQRQAQRPSAPAAPSDDASSPVVQPWRPSWRQGQRAASPPVPPPSGPTSLPSYAAPRRAAAVSVRAAAAAHPSSPLQALASLADARGWHRPRPSNPVRIGGSDHAPLFETSLKVGPWLCKRDADPLLDELRVVGRATNKKASAAAAAAEVLIALSRREDDLDRAAGNEAPPSTLDADTARRTADAPPVLAAPPPLPAATNALHTLHSFLNSMSLPLPSPPLSASVRKIGGTQHEPQFEAQGAVPEFGVRARGHGSSKRRAVEECASRLLDALQAQGIRVTPPDRGRPRVRPGFGDAAPQWRSTEQPQQPLQPLQPLQPVDRVATASTLFATAGAPVLAAPPAAPPGRQGRVSNRVREREASDALALASHLEQLSLPFTLADFAVTADPGPQHRQQWRAVASLPAELGEATYPVVGPSRATIEDARKAAASVLWSLVQSEFAGSDEQADDLAEEAAEDDLAVGWTVCSTCGIGLADHQLVNPPCGHGTCELTEEYASVLPRCPVTSRLLTHGFAHCLPCGHVATPTLVLTSVQDDGACPVCRIALSPDEVRLVEGPPSVVVRCVCGEECEVPRVPGQTKAGELLSLGEHRRLYHDDETSLYERVLVAAALGRPATASAILAEVADTPLHSLLCRTTLSPTTVPHLLDLVPDSLVREPTTLVLDACAGQLELGGWQDAVAESESIGVRWGVAVLLGRQVEANTLSGRESVRARRLQLLNADTVEVNAERGIVLAERAGDGEVAVRDRDTARASALAIAGRLDGKQGEGVDALLAKAKELAR